MVLGFGPGIGTGCSDRWDLSITGASVRLNAVCSKSATEVEEQLFGHPHNSDVIPSGSRFQGSHYNRCVRTKRG